MGKLCSSAPWDSASVDSLFQKRCLSLVDVSGMEPALDDRLSSTDEQALYTMPIIWVQSNYIACQSSRLVYNH
jgi:hypothetical protein